MFFSRFKQTTTEIVQIADKKKYSYGEERIFQLLRDSNESTEPVVNVKLYRIIALRDIPEHGVKAGDLGGWVSKQSTLSHKGNCWIGGEAIVSGLVTVRDNALITGNSQVLSFYTQQIQVGGNAIIQDQARVTNDDTYPYDAGPTNIFDYALIEKNAKVANASLVIGNAIISDYAHLKRGVIVIDSAKVYGKSVIDTLCRISGTSMVFGDTDVASKTNISGCSIIGSNNSNRRLFIATSEIISKICEKYSDFKDNTNGELQRKEPPTRLIPTTKAIESLDSDIEYAQGVFKTINSDIDSYQNDIVKLIKYPTMVDKSHPVTLEMFLALAKCKRVMSQGSPQDIIQSVFDLEKKHMVAESYAKKIAGSLMTIDEKKKAKKAQDLIRIAMDEASTDNEKRSAVKQGLLQLEGVVPLTDVTISGLYKAVGLREIEASY